MGQIKVFTVGHSTHDFEEFVAILKTNGVESVADIRTVPKSRRHPHFHTDSLAQSLPEFGIQYEHVARLGGWRKTDPDSVNAGWRNDSFRGYADYAMGREFAEGLAELRGIALNRVTAMMCSEALWWRCHRRLVADRLISRGDLVRHIGSDGKTSVHELTEFAIVGADGQITYPPEKSG